MCVRGVGEGMGWEGSASGTCLYRKGECVGGVLVVIYSLPFYFPGGWINGWFSSVFFMGAAYICL